MTFWVLQLGYPDLFGGAGGDSRWEDVRRRLDRYSLRAVLDLVARISAFLHNVEGERQAIEAQKRLVDGLFGARGREVWEGVIRERERHPEARSVVLFGELQLINVVKVALLCMPVDDRDSDEDLFALGEAMLLINDLMWSQLEPPVPLDRAAAMPAAWQQMILANHLFHAGGTWRNDLVRSYELYLTDLRDLRTHPDYVDLPASAQRVTGMDATTLWAVLFALDAHWRTIKEANLYEVSGGIDRGRYITANYSFPPEQVERFFGVCTSDVSRIQEEVRARYSLERLEPLDFLPLARTPLVSMGAMTYAVSSKLLADKLDRGLYHLFLDPRFSKDERDRFLRYMGAVFECYVTSVLRRIYPPESHRYIGEDVLRTRIAGKRCDGLILFEDSVVLVEYKATLFPYDVRAGRNWEQLQRVRQDILVDGAEQLHATIEAIQAGALRGEGVDPANIHSYLPVVITHEDVGMSRPLHRRVLEEVAAKGLLAQRGTLALQALSIGELEGLEDDLHGGQSLQRLLSTASSFVGMGTRGFKVLTQETGTARTVFGTSRRMCSCLVAGSF